MAVDVSKSISYLRFMHAWSHGAELVKYICTTFVKEHTSFFVPHFLLRTSVRGFTTQVTTGI